MHHDEWFNCNAYTIVLSLFTSIAAQNKQDIDMADVEDSAILNRN